MATNRNGRLGRRTFLKTASGVGAGVMSLSGVGAAHPPGCDVLVDPSDPHADASTIAGGVAAANAGDTVCVNEATYDEVDILIDKSLTLEGDPGRGNSVGCGDGAPVVDGGGADGSAFLLDDGVSSVTIDGFDVTNFGGARGSGVEAWNISTADVTVQNNCIHGNAWNGVLVGSDGSTTHDGWHLKNNDLFENGAYHLELTNCTHGSIHGNRVDGSAGFGIGILVQARNFVPDSGTLSIDGMSIKMNEVIKDASVGAYLLGISGEENSGAELIDATVQGNGFDANIGNLVWGIGSDDAVIDPSIVRNDIGGTDSDDDIGIWLVDNVETAKLVNNDFASDVETTVSDGGDDTKQPPVPENPS